jgi:ribosomal protein L30E
LSIFLKQNYFFIIAAKEKPKTTQKRSKGGASLAEVCVFPFPRVFAWAFGTTTTRSSSIACVVVVAVAFVGGLRLGESPPPAATPSP